MLIAQATGPLDASTYIAVTDTAPVRLRDACLLDPLQEAQRHP